MSRGHNKSEGLALKMAKRTQEYLKAANAAAAKSIKNVSYSSHFTETPNMNDAYESKSQGRIGEHIDIAPFSQSQENESFEQDRYKKLVHVCTSQETYIRDLESQIK